MNTRKLQPMYMPGPGIFPAIYGFLTNRLDFLTSIADRYGDKVMFNVLLDKLYLVTDPDEVRRVLLSDEFHRIYPDALSSVIGKGLLASEGDYWRDQHQRMSPYFHTKQIETFSQVITDQTQLTLQSWIEGLTNRPIEVYASIKQLTHRIVMQALFSDNLKSDEIAEVGRAINTVLGYFDTTLLFPTLLAVREHLPTPGTRQFHNSKHTINRTVDRVIQDRRQREHSSEAEVTQRYYDLMEMLLIAQDNADLTNQQVKDEVLTMFIAGYETSASAIAWTLYLLAQYRPELERATNEVRSVLGDRTPTFKDVASLPFLRQTLDESLRLYPPAWLIGRYAVQETSIGGYRVEPKYPILISPYVIHRQKSLWPEANAFRPERFAPNQQQHHRYSYLPFGAGEHVCIGQHLALTEAMLILAMVLQRFDVQLPPNYTLERTVGAVLQPKSLWLNIQAKT